MITLLLVIVIRLVIRLVIGTGSEYNTKSLGGEWRV